MPGASPSFTVILPVYKGEAFLAETLESLLAQTYPPEHIILLEDGSPGPSADRSAEIAQSFGPRIQLIRKSNSGVSDTRNTGAALSTSSFLCFLDQDDIWTPDHLARHADVLRANPSADVSYSGRRHLYEELETGTFRLSEPIAVPPTQLFPAVIVDRCPFTPSAAAIRRSSFLAVGGFRSEHNSVEDWDLWLRLTRAGAQFVHSPEPTLFYRIHIAANTNNPLPILRTNLAVIRDNILPHLSPLDRLTTGRRIVSRLEGEAAILLRQNQLPGALPLMLRSLARHPFHESRRYKIAAHMLLRAARLR